MFKKLLTMCLIAIAFFAISSTSYGKSAANFASNAISIDPLDFLINRVLHVNFEHKMDAVNTFTISGSYYSYSDWWKAYGLGGSYRWYMDVMKEKKKAMEGFSVGPRADIAFWTFSNSYGLANESYTSFYIGGEAAYKFLFDNFFIEPIIRLEFGVNSVAGLGYSGFGAGVNCGMTF